jgi:hypothetical protein
MTGVDSRGLTWTRGDATEARKRSGIELLSRKDERHRLVGNCRTPEFDSRQLHNCSLKTRVADVHQTPLYCVQQRLDSVQERTILVSSTRFAQWRCGPREFQRRPRRFEDDSALGIALLEEGERRAAPLARPIAAVLETGDVGSSGSYSSSWGACSSLRQGRSEALDDDDIGIRSTKRVPRFAAKRVSVSCESRA